MMISQVKEKLIKNKTKQNKKQQTKQNKKEQTSKLTNKQKYHTLKVSLQQKINSR